MNKPHGCNVEQKKPDTQGYLLHDSVYIDFTSKQNSSVVLLQEGGHWKGSCLTLRNELSEETHVLTKQGILLGKGAWVESRRVRDPREQLCRTGSQSWVLR